MKLHSVSLKSLRRGWRTAVRLVKSLVLVALLSTLGTAACTGNSWMVAGPAAAFLIATSLATIAYERRPAAVRVRR
jgi:hypothetical protein